MLGKYFFVKRRKTGATQGSFTEQTCILGFNSLHSKRYSSENPEFIFIFSFLWTASKQSEGIPLAKWKTLANLKELGGWGIKNAFLFCQSLETTIMWRLIQNPSTFWGKVLVSKYCPNASITEWIRKLDKSYNNGSIGWKSFVLAFLQIRNKLEID